LIYLFGREELIVGGAEGNGVCKLCPCWRVEELRQGERLNASGFGTWYKGGGAKSVGRAFDFDECLGWVVHSMRE
jgi:hypothetical protein